MALCRPEISRAVTQAATGASELRGNIQSVVESACRSGQTAADIGECRVAGGPALR
jgi:hypothetical protein